jgi:NAD(P)-dependent dehydrogenase (short-subunit alcohol dehydrogenase family)
VDYGPSGKQPTGANSGLGFLTSLKLAEHGAHVIMTARDLRKGRDAQARIEEAHTKGSVELRQLDLADLAQVGAFANRLLAERTPVDTLINNAGIMMPPRALTAQGHELQFGVNHLAHFALASMLLPRIRASGAGRIVTITSDLHKRGRIHFDDLTGERKYGRIEFYAQSKFANVLFALELDRHLRAAGSPSACPSWVRRHEPATERAQRHSQTIHALRKSLSGAICRDGRAASTFCRDSARSQGW